MNWSTSRRAWAIWCVGGLAYAVTVFHRTSLGVAGLQAQERFGVTAAGLSLIAVMQLAVYAAMQVPVGVLVDRFGPRRVLLAAALVMGLGQATMALTYEMPFALMARVLVGAGDAMTFVSVIRLLVAWFPGHRVPLITQFTSTLGQFGQIAAAYPLVAMLRSVGWSTSFLIIGALGLGVSGLVAALVRDEPEAGSAMPAANRRGMIVAVAAAWREPGTRLGLWAHFVTLFPGMTFVVLWGYPFLVQGQQRSPETAALLLSLMVVIGMLVGPVLGWIVGRSPSKLHVVVLVIVAATASAWAVVLAWPGRVPMALLIVLIAALATNAPGSIIPFDYGRAYNPPARVGSAIGIINVGGFAATLLTVFAIGLVLQVLSPSGRPDEYTRDAFRLAFCVQYAVWAAGLVMFLRQHAVVRRRPARIP